MEIINVLNDLKILVDASDWNASLSLIQQALTLASGEEKTLIELMKQLVTLAITLGL